MSRRTAIHLEEVVAWENLVAAFWRAAAGKRDRIDVRRFEANLYCKLRRLQRDVCAGAWELGRAKVFRIRDPKPRMIHAPVFDERVLHHALMAKVGPVLDRTLIDDTFACRVGKGTLAAVRRTQQMARSYGFFAKLDVRSYFASIDHRILQAMIRRSVKGHSVLDLIDRIIKSHRSTAGKGLPIGALTSQYFANFYLGPLDREICAFRDVGHVRYMDDVVLLGRSREGVQRAASLATQFAEERLALEIKADWRAMPVQVGIPLCGYRIHPERLFLSKRRMRRYRSARKAWEVRYGEGQISSSTLQRGYDVARAITAHGGASAWRRQELLHRAAPDA